MPYKRIWTCFICIFAVASIISAASAQTERRADVPSSLLFDSWPQWKERHEALVAQVKQAKDAQIVFIGDSITQGWEGAGAAVWTKYYAPRKALNLGISGDQVQYCMWRLDHGELEGLDPKLAIVMIGTNNCWGDEFPVDQTTNGIKLLVQQLRKKLPNTKILLLGIFPREDLSELMRTKPVSVNNVISKLHDGKFIYYMDIGKSFLDETGHISRDTMGDLLHPTAKGYQIWAEAIEPIVDKIVGREAAAKTDKTLVSWVSLANVTQQGGSALTAQSGDQFDGIVFGENTPGKWAAGSNFFSRTQKDQQANATEQSDSNTLLQMAIVYKGNNITIYRNAEPYASYEANNIDLLSPNGNIAVFGLRHRGAASGGNLRGYIDDARIYDKALTADELKQLQPNKESAIKPYAWWTFEKGKETDRMKKFPVNNLSGGAMIEDGHLILEGNASELIAAKSKTPNAAVGEFETPAMPANPPDDWLTFHLLHPGPGGAMPGDPNCAFYWKGEYHLFYIYNHVDGYAFAHVSSKDMVHWKWHPTTLTPKTTGHGMFSGTGFLTKEGKPAMIYHGVGSDRNQIAFAMDDKLEKWTKPIAVEPLTEDGKLPEMRHWDPDCWLNGDTYYATSGGGNPTLMKSTDLKNWKFIGPLLSDDYPADLGMPKGEDISCGNMFKIGSKWMLLCISHGLGCRYYLGDFKNEKYLPDFQALMSWNGNNYFAPESVLTKDSHRVMWAWLLNLPVAPCGVQSLPRELELSADGVLRIKPLRELESLRYDKHQEEAINIKSDTTSPLKDISGNTFELEVEFKPTAAKEYGIDVLSDKTGQNGVRIAYIPESKTLKVGTVSAPFELKQNENLTLRIFVDKNLVEVFANDRQAAASAGKYFPENLGLSLFSNGGDSTVKQIKSWKMKSIYQNK